MCDACVGACVDAGVDVLMAVLFMILLVMNARKFVQVRRRVTRFFQCCTVCNF